MATATFGVTIPGMSDAQFEALPPHKKLLHATKMPSEFMMNTAIVDRSQAIRLGLTTGAGTGTHLFCPIYPRTKRPILRSRRALNSWMAFRCMSFILSPLIRTNLSAFYFTIFKKYTQKTASRHLKLLWDADPFHAKWAILARAYSNIRTLLGKTFAPLDRFFIIACPAIGVIDSTEYLAMMSWEWVVVDGVKKLVQTAVPNLASFAHHIRYTTMTDRDIVHRCAREYYISQTHANTIAGPPGGHGLAAQQGLMASAPGVGLTVGTAATAAGQQVPVAPTAAALTVTPAAANAPSVGQLGSVANSTTPNPASSNNSVQSVSSFLGSDIPTLVNPPAYQWTGSLIDLYHPSEGLYDFGMVGSRIETVQFNTGDISDPSDFDAMFNDALVDGFLQPDGK